MCHHPTELVGHNIVSHTMTLQATLTVAEEFGSSIPLVYLSRTTSFRTLTCSKTGGLIGSPINVSTGFEPVYMYCALHIWAKSQLTLDLNRDLKTYMQDIYPAFYLYKKILCDFYLFTGTGY